MKASFNPSHFRLPLMVFAGTLLTSLGVAQNLLISPSSLTFTAQAGARGSIPQSIDVTSGGSPVSFVVSAFANWLTVIGTTPIGPNAWQATTPISVSVFADPSFLAPGQYTATINVAPNGSTTGVKTIGVTLNVGQLVQAAALVVSPSSFSFSAQAGSSPPASQSLIVTNSGPSFPFMATVVGGNWLSVNTSTTGPGSSLQSNTNQQNVILLVNQTGLSAGSYNATVLVSAASASNSPQTIPVALTITAPAQPPTPKLSLSSNAISFQSEVGTTPPPAQTILVTSSNAGFSYTASGTGGSWLSSIPTQGTTPGALNISVNPTGLSLGTYNGSITVTRSWEQLRRKQSLLTSQLCLLPRHRKFHWS
jgi:hypothetical protein